MLTKVNAKVNAFDKYRFDIRTKEQAVEDIRQGTKRQNLVVEAFIRYWEMVMGETPKVEDYGCDNSGEFLEKEKVNANADIKLNGHLIEIKTAYGYPKEIWLKKRHVDKLVNQGAHILFCFGDFKKKDVNFTIIFNDKLRDIVNNAEIDYPENYGFMKAVYVVPTDEFQWAKLPF